MQMGKVTTITFEYGQDINYGSSASGSPNPITGSSPTGVSANITGINPGITYHFRVKTVSLGVTAYGTDQHLQFVGELVLMHMNHQTLMPRRLH